jgi:hypothetical protein
MPAPRVDWAQIKSLWPAGDERILILNQRAINLLLSLLPRYEWLATYGHTDEAIEDWDDIQALMSETEMELGTAMKVQELIPYIDEIEDLLRGLNEVGNCCDAPDPSNGDFYTDPVEDYVGDVPQNIIDAGYASDTSDWDGFMDYKCMICHLFVDQIEADLRQLAPTVKASGLIVGGFSTVAAVLALLAVPTGGLSLLVAGIVAATAVVADAYAALAVLGSAGLLALADELASDHDEIVCAMYQADGSASMETVWQDKTDELYTDTQAAVLHNMNIGPRIKALYSARYNQTDIAERMDELGLDPADYDCSCPLPAGYNWVNAGDITYLADADTFGRVNGATVSGPFITFGGTVANSASWGCATYPSTLTWIKTANHDYQTLAIRYTVVEYNGNNPGKAPPFTSTCTAVLNERLIWFYTLDTAEGIDTTWADAESDQYYVEAGGHDKRAVDYVWQSGQVAAVHTTPGTSGIYMKLKVEHLVWVT